MRKSNISETLGAWQQILDSHEFGADSTVGPIGAAGKLIRNMSRFHPGTKLYQLVIESIILGAAYGNYANVTGSRVSYQRYLKKCMDRLTLALRTIPKGGDGRLESILTEREDANYLAHLSSSGQLSEEILDAFQSDPDLMESYFGVITSAPSATETLREPVVSYVMSIDIRRSTQLMSLCIDPKRFKDFVEGFTNKCQEFILSADGFYDKFTGDGVLACFPMKFVGEKSATASLLTTAVNIKNAFHIEFDRLRGHLKEVPSIRGVGIGISYGDVTFGQINGRETVLGEPVVSACRLASAPANVILLGDRAKRAVERAIKNVPAEICRHAFKATRHHIKHEGDFDAWRLKAFEYRMETLEPVWRKKLAAHSDNKRA